MLIFDLCLSLVSFTRYWKPFQLSYNAPVFIQVKACDGISLGVLANFCYRLCLVCERLRKRNDLLYGLTLGSNSTSHAVLQLLDHKIGYQWSWQNVALANHNNN
jgi:hypothetical protein